MKRTYEPHESYICKFCTQKHPATYFTNDKNRITKVCKLCKQKKAKSIRRAFKAKCVAYKGGRCEICGYNKCIAALQFHHKDPSAKEFVISQSSKHIRDFDLIKQ